MNTTNTMLHQVITHTSLLLSMIFLQWVLQANAMPTPETQTEAAKTTTDIRHAYNRAISDVYPAHVVKGKFDLKGCTQTAYKMAKKNQLRQYRQPVSLPSQYFYDSYACNACIQIDVGGTGTHELTNGDYFEVLGECTDCRPDEFQTTNYLVKNFDKSMTYNYTFSPCPWGGLIQYKLEIVSNFLVRIFISGTKYPVVRLLVKASNLKKWHTTKHSPRGYFYVDKPFNFFHTRQWDTRGNIHIFTSDSHHNLRKVAIPNANDTWHVGKVIMDVVSPRKNITTLAPELTSSSPMTEGTSLYTSPQDLTTPGIEGEDSSSTSTSAFFYEDISTTIDDINEVTTSPSDMSSDSTTEHGMTFPLMANNNRFDTFLNNTIEEKEEEEDEEEEEEEEEDDEEEKEEDENEEEEREEEENTEEETEEEEKEEDQTDSLALLMSSSQSYPLEISTVETETPTPEAEKQTSETPTTKYPVSEVFIPQEKPNKNPAVISRPDPVAHLLGLKPPPNQNTPTTLGDNNTLLSDATTTSTTQATPLHSGNNKTQTLETTTKQMAENSGENDESLEESNPSSNFWANLNESITDDHTTDQIVPLQNTSESVNEMSTVHQSEIGPSTQFINEGNHQQTSSSQLETGESDSNYTSQEMIPSKSELSGKDPSTEEMNEGELITLATEHEDEPIIEIDKDNVTTVNTTLPPQKVSTHSSISNNKENATSSVVSGATENSNNQNVTTTKTNDETETPLKSSENETSIIHSTNTDLMHHQSSTVKTLPEPAFTTTHHPLGGSTAENNSPYNETTQNQTRVTTKVPPGSTISTMSSMSRTMTSTIMTTTPKTIEEEEIEEEPPSAGTNSTNPGDNPATEPSTQSNQSVTKPSSHEEISTQTTGSNFSESFVTVSPSQKVNSTQSSDNFAIDPPQSEVKTTVISHSFVTESPTQSNDTVVTEPSSHESESSSFSVTIATEPSTQKITDTSDTEPSSPLPPDLTETTDVTITDSSTQSNSAEDTTPAPSTQPTTWSSSPSPTPPSTTDDFMYRSSSPSTESLWIWGGNTFGQNFEFNEFSTLSFNFGGSTQAIKPAPFNPFLMGRPMPNGGAVGGQGPGTFIKIGMTIRDQEAEKGDSNVNPPEPVNNNNNERPVDLPIRRSMLRGMPLRDVTTEATIDDGDTTDLSGGGGGDFPIKKHVDKQSEEDTTVQEGENNFESTTPFDGIDINDIINGGSGLPFAPPLFGKQPPGKEEQEEEEEDKQSTSPAPSDSGDQDESKQFNKEDDSSTSNENPTAISPLLQGLASINIARVESKEEEELEDSDTTKSRGSNQESASGNSQDMASSDGGKNVEKTTTKQNNDLEENEENEQNSEEDGDNENLNQLQADEPPKKENEKNNKKKGNTKGKGKNKNKNKNKNNNSTTNDDDDDDDDGGESGETATLLAENTLTESAEGGGEGKEKEEEEDIVSTEGSEAEGEATGDEQTLITELSDIEQEKNSTGVRFGLKQRFTFTSTGVTIATTTTGCQAVRVLVGLLAGMIGMAVS